MAAGADILVLGVGNTLLSDDGLGVRALELLENTYRFPPEVTLIDGGTGGLTLVSAFEGKSLVIILDAVATWDLDKPGGDRPEIGKPIRIDGRLLNTVLGAGAARSLHDIGMNDVLAISVLEGKRPELILIGMLPARIAPGTELSAVVKEGLTGVVDMVVAELERVGVRGRKR